MVGFLFAHEQFTVPQLIDIEISAEQAGFDLLATSDHFNPGRRMKAAAAWHEPL